MRIIFACLTLLIASSAYNAASAEIAYPWCAYYGGKAGGTNCGFSTLQQCQWAISGNGGYCGSNLSYHAQRSSSSERRYRR
jgi:hypothetical protein